MRPSYLARHGAPRSIDDLAQHRCSGFRHPGTGKLMPWEFRVGNEIVARHLPATFCANDVELEAEAVLAGHAVGQLVGVNAAPLIRASRLRPLLCEHVTDHLHLYVYYGSRVALPTRVRAFVDLVVERVADNPEFFLRPDELVPATQRRRRAPALGSNASP